MCFKTDRKKKSTTLHLCKFQLLLFKEHLTLQDRNLLLVLVFNKLLTLTTMRFDPRTFSFPGRRHGHTAYDYTSRCLKYCYFFQMSFSKIKCVKKYEKFLRQIHFFQLTIILNVSHTFFYNIKYLLLYLMFCKKINSTHYVLCT